MDYSWEDIREIRDENILYDLLPPSAKIMINKNSAIKYWTHLELRKIHKKVKPAICPICKCGHSRMDIHIVDYYDPSSYVVCCHSCHMKHHKGSLFFLKSTNGKVQSEDWDNGEQT